MASGPISDLAVAPEHCELAFCDSVEPCCGRTPFRVELMTVAESCCEGFGAKICGNIRITSATDKVPQQILSMTAIEHFGHYRVAEVAVRGRVAHRSAPPHPNSEVDHRSGGELKIFSPSGHRINSCSSIQVESPTRSSPCSTQDCDPSRKCDRVCPVDSSADSVAGERDATLPVGMNFPHTRTSHTLPTLSATNLVRRSFACAGTLLQKTSFSRLRGQ